MNRQIIGFHQDEHGDWVADLDCGHSYHMRHNPPWQVRDWVLTQEGRERFIGQTLDCTKCNQSSAFSPAASNKSDTTFYDELAEHYHLLFEDWDRSIARQAVGGQTAKGVRLSMYKLTLCYLGTQNGVRKTAKRGGGKTGSD